jgi:hypothetical protein
MSKTFFFDENAVLAKRLVIFDQLFLSFFIVKQTKPQAGIFN